MTPPGRARWQRWGAPPSPSGARRRPSHSAAPAVALEGSQRFRQPKQGGTICDHPHQGGQQGTPPARLPRWVHPSGCRRGSHKAALPAHSAPHRAPWPPRAGRCPCPPLLRPRPHLWTRPGSGRADKVIVTHPTASTYPNQSMTTTTTLDPVALRTHLGGRLGRPRVPPPVGHFREVEALLGDEQRRHGLLQQRRQLGRRRLHQVVEAAGSVGLGHDASAVGPSSQWAQSTRGLQSLPLACAHATFLISIIANRHASPACDSPCLPGVLSHADNLVREPLPDAVRRGLPAGGHHRRRGCVALEALRHSTFIQHVPPHPTAPRERGRDRWCVADVPTVAEVLPG